MRFRLVSLGELSVYDESQRKIAVPRKALALMAILAAEGKALSRDRLTMLLWPERGEPGRQALKQVIYELRQALGNGSVISGTAEISLDASLVSSDVVDVEAAYATCFWSRVVELYGGPFIDGFHVRDSVEFDHWADARRAHYESLFRQALERLARIAAERGDTGEAVALWRRLAAKDDLSAPVAIGLVDALAAAGDIAGALKYYQAYQRRMHEELGVTPEPAVVAAVERARARTAARPIAPGTAELQMVRDRPPPQTASRPTRRAMRVWIPVAAAALAIVALVAVARNWNRGARVLTSVTLPQRAFQVTVDPHLEKVYVDGGASFDATLSVVDGRTDSVWTVPHGAGTAVDPVTHWYWSGDYGGRVVVVRNGRTDVEIARISVPGCPHDFAIAGDIVWVAQQCDDHISVIDSRRRRVIRNIPVPTLSRQEVGGAKGMGEIFVNRNTGVVYFSKDGIPHRLDPSNWEMRETHGFDGQVIAVNEPTNRLYVRIERGLRIIDGSSEKMIGQVLLPSTPRAAAIGFGGRQVYVTTDAGLVALDGETQRVLYVLPLGDGFVADAVSVDVARNRAYVAGNERSGERSLKIVTLGDEKTAG